MSYVHIAIHQLCFGHIANCTLLHPVMTESKSPTTLKTNSPFGWAILLHCLLTSYLLSLMVQNIGTHYVTSQGKSCSNSHQGGLPSHLSIICKQLLNMCHPSTSANEPACQNFSQKFSISKLQHPTLARQNIGQDSGIKNCTCINSFSITNLIREVELHFHWHPANPHFCYQMLHYSFTRVPIMDFVAVHPLSHSDGEHTHCHLTFANTLSTEPTGKPLN